MKKAEEIIPELINLYRGKHPRLSKTAICRREKFCVNTFNRLMDGTFNKSLINIHKLREFMNAITDNETIIDEIIDSDELLKENRRKNYPHLDKLRKKYITPKSEILNYITSEQFKSLVFIRSAMRNGISENQIVEEFGNSGLLAANDLFNEGIIEKNENGYYEPSFYEYNKEDQNDFIAYDRPNIIQTMIHLLGFCRTIKNENDTTCVGFQYQTWTIEFLLKVENKIKALLSEIAEEGKLEENIGKIPAYIGVFLDTFNKRGQ